MYLWYHEQQPHSQEDQIIELKMSGIQHALDTGAVPAHVSNVCPIGTKAYLLELGWLECDEGFVVRGGNTSLKSTEGQSFVNKRRELPMYAVLIDHPHEGLILWETGSGKNYPEVWGPAVADVFSRVKYEPRHELRAAIEATGNKIEDVKKMFVFMITVWSFADVMQYPRPSPSRPCRRSRRVL